MRKLGEVRGATSMDVPEVFRIANTVRLATGEAKSSGSVWGRQKSTWHTEATCWRKYA